MLRARLLDVALALACAVAGQVELRHHGGDGITLGPGWVNVVVLLVVDLAVVGWRVAPGAALLVMASALLGPSLVTAHAAYFWTTILPMMLVVYRNAAGSDRRLARWGWLLVAAGMASVSLRAGDDLIGNLVTMLVFFGGGSLAGRLVRRSRHQLDQLEAALAELEVEQAHREEAAAQTERNRIATETHDLVAHAISEMVLQVGAARMGLQAAHLAVPDQLSAAEDTGRRALTDLRRSIGVLPDRGDRGLAPMPGIAALDHLVAGFRAAGLDVHLHQTEALDSLPSGLQLAVHRVLQESLTNARKHAGPVRVDVRLGHAGPDVVLEVRNAPPDGEPPPLPSGGHGLIGMRERVSLYGGLLLAAPDPDGGFRVRATWPVLTIDPALDRAVDRTVDPAPGAVAVR